MSRVGGTAPERIRALEIRVEQLLEDGLRREEKQELILEDVKILLEKLGEVKTEMARQKGFMGAIVWVAAALGTAVYNFAGPIWKWIVQFKTGGSG